MINNKIIILFFFACSINAFAQSNWKTETEFKAAEPIVLSKANWLINNPFDNNWGDSLKFVMSWGNDVPYITIGTKGNYTKEIRLSSTDNIAGRLSSVWLVGVIKYYVEFPKNRSNNNEIAKSGILALVKYYDIIKASHSDFSIPIIESYKNMISDNSIDEYIKNKEK